MAKFLIFHHDDMDGLSAAAIVKHAYGKDNEFKFVEVDYARRIVEVTPDYNPVDFDATIIVDLSLNQDTIPQFKGVINASKKCIWIDHHKTSVEFSEGDDLLTKVDGLRDTRFCGAYLAYIYFNLGIADMELFTEEKKKLIPEWIDYVDDWDTWKKQKGNGTLWFKYAFDANDNDPNNDRFYDQFYSNPKRVSEIMTIGSVIHMHVIKDYERALDHLAYEATFEGYRVLVLNRRGNSLMFGSRINDYDFVVGWEFNGEVYKYSLYTVKDFDLTVIAKKYGGGGHPKACGFSTTEKLV